MKMTKNSRLVLAILMVALSCLLILGCVFLLLPFGTTPSPEKKMEIIFNSQPSCKPPCWRGLVPNITTEEEFLKFIELEQSEHNIQLSKARANGLVSYDWEDINSRMLIQVNIEEGLVRVIRFTPEASLGQLLDTLGTPDALTAAAPFDMGFYAELLFFYEKQGVMGHASFSELPEGPHPWSTCKLDVMKDLPIRWIHFVEPNKAKEMREVINYYNANERIQTWTEFGPVALDPCANISVP